MHFSAQVRQEEPAQQQFEGPHQQNDKQCELTRKEQLFQFLSKQFPNNASYAYSLDNFQSHPFKYDADAECTLSEAHQHRLA
eukprot:7969354-Ditylum_brightwellii.AAC.1